MFDFHFAYSDGNVYDVKNVTKAFVKTLGGKQELTGDDILTEKICLSDMFLYTPNGNVTISGANLMVVDIMKQND